MNEIKLGGTLKRKTMLNENVLKATIAIPNTKGVDYINVTAFKEIAKNIQTLQEGVSILVVGRISTNSYEKNGKKNYTQEVVITKIL